MFCSIQYRNGWLAAFNLFDMFTQSIRFYTIHYQYRSLKNVIHQIDSKNECCYFQQILWQNLGQFLSQHQKTLLLRGFIFKSTERAQVLLNNGTRDFQNSPPLERSACFYVTINENFEHFQYFNFETDFLENENFFQKTGVKFFS